MLLFQKSVILNFTKKLFGTRPLGHPFLYPVFTQKMSSEKESSSSKRKMEDVSKSTTQPAKKGHWSAGLLHSMNDPEMIAFSDDLLVIIKDKYPKVC